MQSIVSKLFLTIFNLKLRHHFHETCLKRWLKINGQCPVCRTRIGQPGPHKHNEDIQENAENLNETENNLI